MILILGQCNELFQIIQTLSVYDQLKFHRLFFKSKLVDDTLNGKVIEKG